MFQSMNILKKTNYGAFTHTHKWTTNTNRLCLLANTWVYNPAEPYPDLQ